MFRLSCFSVCWLSGFVCGLLCGGLLDLCDFLICVFGVVLVLNLWFLGLWIWFL